MMSVFEYLFLDPGHADAGRAATALAETFGLTVTHGNTGALYLGTVRLAPERPYHIGGRIEPNDYGALDPPQVPEDLSIFDDMPLVWSLWTAGDDTDDFSLQQARARGVFDLVVEKLGWTSILVHDFETLLATYDPVRGLREFPPGTPSDGTGAHLWR